MAIKGKSKPKGGTKVVARGPKPTYVPVRRPLLARRSFWYSVGAVVLVLAVAGIWYGLAKERASAREAALARRMRTVALRYRGSIDPVITPLGRVVPPSAFEAFPELGGALGDVVDGKAKPRALADTAAAVAGAAERAAKDLEALDPAGLFGGKGFDQPFVLHAINAKDRLVQALRLYRQAALLATDAASASGQEASRIAVRAKEVFDVASELFSDGYQDYVEVQFAAGVFRPVLPGSTP